MPVLLFQDFLQLMRFDHGRGADLACHPRTYPIRYFIHLVERRSVKVFVDQCRGEGITCADGVGHLDSKSGMHAASVRSREHAAAVATRDTNQFQAVLLDEAAR